MPSSMPLYYAGVASDDDVLEEMLKKDKKLEHGSSTTIDLQRYGRLLGVSYQQVPLSRVKKMTAAVITVVAIILFISLTFHSAATSKTNTQAIASSASPTGKHLTSHHVIDNMASSKATPKKLKEKKDSIPKNDPKTTLTMVSQVLTKKPSPKQNTHTTNLPTKLPTTHTPTTNNHKTSIPSILDRTDIVPIPTRKPAEFVLAMNPSIPAHLNLHCRSCAVVTNSADLYESNAGSVIESSECVIRLNTAPTIGHEVDVGGKTTVRVVSQDHLGDLLHHVWHDPDEMSSLRYVVIYGQKNALCQNCTFFKLFKSIAGEYLGDKFIRYTNTLKTNLESRKDIDEVSLSTQFHAINIMRNVCNKMRVFGVEQNHPCLSDRSYRRNYWQRNKYVDCDGHRDDVVKDIRRYRFEKKIYDQWRDRYDLEFLYP